MAHNNFNEINKMALTRLTNKTDRNGNLIQQIIITDEEETHFKKLAAVVAEELIEQDHEKSGQPETPRKRAARNYKLNTMIWICAIAAGLLTTGLIIKLLSILGIGR